MEERMVSFKSKLQGLLKNTKEKPLSKEDEEFVKWLQATNKEHAEDLNKLGIDRKTRM